MKKIQNIIYRIILLVIGTEGITACSDEKDYTAHFHNYIQLSIEGNNTLHEDETTPITVQILLANTLTEDASISLELMENKENILRLEQPTLHIKAGSKEAQTEIFSNQKGILNQQQSVRLRVKSYSDPQMEAWNETTVIVKPNSDIPELSEEQIALIAGYKEKWGLDLNRFIGKLKCKTEVTFNSSDMGILYDEKEQVTYEGISILTLSEKATAEKPILKITSNPLGMTSFLWDMMQRCTINNETWNDVYNPEPQDILKAIKYEKGKETFEVFLDDIELIPPKQEAKFLHPVMTSEGNEEIGPTLLTIVPFQYQFSLWERFQEYAEKDMTYSTKEGETPMEKYLKDVSEMYRPNPTYHLSYSNLDSDGWEDETYQPAHSEYDLNKGSWSFTFSWDCQVSGGYTRIRCTYILPDYNSKSSY